MAALYGGTTTLIDFAYILSNGSVRADIEARDKQFADVSAWNTSTYRQDRPCDPGGAARCWS